MIKKFVALLLLMVVMGFSIGVIGEEFPENRVIKIHPLEEMDAPIGKVEIQDEQIAMITSTGKLKALIQGETTLVVHNQGGEKKYILSVKDEYPTENVKKAIDIAIKEWEEFGGKRLGKSNKYTKWYCNKECSFGWCGAFIGWALDEGEVEMCYWADAVPVDKDQSFAIREAGVGKIITGYRNLERLTRIPRPGYINIYGVRKKANETVHVGFITDVEYIKDEIYLVSTVEGNLGTVIKRYQYYYDASEEAREKQENIFSIEEEKQTQEGMNYQYVENWYVNVIGQTYE